MQNFYATQIILENSGCWKLKTRHFVDQFIWNANQLLLLQCIYLQKLIHCASWQICRTDLFDGRLWRPRSKFLQLIRKFVTKLYLPKGFWLHQNKNYLIKHIWNNLEINLNVRPADLPQHTRKLRYYHKLFNC